MKQGKIYCSVLFILTISINYTFSQKRFKRFNYVDGWSITPNLGIGSVSGELGNIFHFNTIYGINIAKGISEKFNFNIEIVGGILDGSEDKDYNSSFKNNFFQINVLPTINISRVFSEKKKNIELLSYLGIGSIWFNTSVYSLKTGTYLRATSDGTTKHTSLFQQAGIGVGEAGIYYTRELTVPVGLILNYEISDKLALTSTVGYNYIYNDKFDGTTPYNLTNPYIVGGINSYSDTANDGWIRISLGMKIIISTNNSENQRGLAYK